jgi:hypothetical protein
VEAMDSIIRSLTFFVLSPESINYKANTLISIINLQRYHANLQELVYWFIFSIKNAELPRKIKVKPASSFK